MTAYAKKQGLSFVIYDLHNAGRGKLSGPNLGQIQAYFPLSWANEERRLTRMESRNYRKRLEARVGIEPTHKGFADLSLTTWVPRPCSIKQRSEPVHHGARSQLETTESGAGDGI